jgi:hypothetical protein
MREYPPGTTESNFTKEGGPKPPSSLPKTLPRPLPPPEQPLEEPERYSTVGTLERNVGVEA